MMVQAKRIYILMIKVIKNLFPFFIAVFSIGKRNRKQLFSLFLSCYRDTRESFNGRTRKSCGNTYLPVQLASPQHFLFSQTSTHVSKTFKVPLLDTTMLYLSFNFSTVLVPHHCHASSFSSVNT